MSRKDQDTFTEPSFIPRSVAPQKFSSPGEYLDFLKENELVTAKNDLNLQITKESEIGKMIFKTLEQSSHKTVDLEELSRNFYFWPFAGKTLDSVSNFPKLYTRSKVSISDFSRKIPSHDHSLALQLIKSRRQSISEKTKSFTKTPTTTDIEHDEEDIFADAGRDYVVTVDESFTHSNLQDSIDLQESVHDIEPINIHNIDNIDTIDNIDILKDSAADIVDTDMMDLDLDEIELSNFQDSTIQPTKKLKLRSDFESEEAWNSYSETQSLLLSSSHVSFQDSKPRGRGRGSNRQRGSNRGSQRGSQRGSTRGKGKLDKELDAVGKVYKEKYGSSL